VAAPQNGDGVEALKAVGRAEVLLERAKSGEDFSELARLYSEDASGAQGGDLGLIRRGEILPDIEAVLFSLQQDEIGPLIRTSAGYHIIKLTEKTLQEAPPFEQVADRIRGHVYTEKLNVRYERWLEDLKKKAYIEVSM
jgi:parvulin-like peptidyl-prolyl isomerase